MFLESNMSSNQKIYKVIYKDNVPLSNFFTMMAAISFSVNNLLGPGCSIQEPVLLSTFGILYNSMSFSHCMKSRKY